MNPFAVLDGLLSDYASPKVRRTLHSLLVLAAIGASIFLAAEKDWEVALGTLIAALYAWANRANTDPVPSGSEQPLPLSDEGGTENYYRGDEPTY